MKSRKKTHLQEHRHPLLGFFSYENTYIWVVCGRLVWPQQRIAKDMCSNEIELYYAQNILDNHSRLNS